jgi:hypothetical protein
MHTERGGGRPNCTAHQQQPNQSIQTQTQSHRTIPPSAQPRTQTRGKGWQQHHRDGQAPIAPQRQRNKQRRGEQGEEIVNYVTVIDVIDGRVL